MSHPVFSIFAQHEFHDIIDTEVNSPLNWTEPDVSEYRDNYYYTITYTHQPGDRFPFGQTIVSYTVQDNIGTCDTYSFAVVTQGKTSSSLNFNKKYTSLNQLLYLKLTLNQLRQYLFIFITYWPSVNLYL